MRSSLTAFLAPIARAAAAGAIALLLAAPCLQAQAIRGTVVRSTDDAPIIGVVVLLIDSTELARARSLTDARGTFQLRAPTPGTYRLRTLRTSDRRGFRGRRDARAADGGLSHLAG